MRRTRFITWAKKDPEDTTPIRYTFKGWDKTHHFTSEDTVSPAMMERIRWAWIEKIEKIDGRWDVILQEDK